MSTRIAINPVIHRRPVPRAFPQRLRYASEYDPANGCAVYLDDFTGKVMLADEASAWVLRNAPYVERERARRSSEAARLLDLARTKRAPATPSPSQPAREVELAIR